MKRYPKLLLGIIAVIAAITIPLALISAAVIATTGYSEYQILATPEAKISTSDVTNNTVRVTFSIDRSNMVINSAHNSTGKDKGTKYDYIDNYMIYLIDMNLYDEEVKRKASEGNQAVIITQFKDREIEIIGNYLYINKDTSQVNSEGKPIVEPDAEIELEKKDVYLLTADTVIQADKTYYSLNGTEYVPVDYKSGSPIEKGSLYEKEENTTFSFRINDLFSDHKYAIGVQFNYSADDIQSTLYNRNLENRKEFKTK